jgi:hypothetical protein
MTTPERRRQLEVMAEFGLLTAVLGGDVADLFRPPWRARLVTGELSPPYGPSSVAAYTVELRAFRFSKAGGGLWDASREHRRPAPAPVQECGFLTLAEYIRLHGAELAPDELRVAVLLAEARGRVMPGHVARRLEIPRARAEKLMQAVVWRWQETNAGREGAA